MEEKYGHRAVYFFLPENLLLFILICVILFAALKHTSAELLKKCSGRRFGISCHSPGRVLYDYEVGGGLKLLRRRVLWQLYR